MTTRLIYCCNCKEEVDAVLVTGAGIYPHRPDLKKLPFWQCKACNAFVGCHHKTKDRTRPLGFIPSVAVKEARKKVHRIIDPLWQSGKISRRQLYAALSKAVGKEYHTAEIRTVEEAELVISTALAL